MNAIKVVVIDDHELFREGVISMLGRDPSIQVVGEGGSLDDALRLANEARPDIALLDVMMPGGGLATAKRLSETNPSIRLMMLTVSETADDVVAAFQYGVLGYVLKGIRRSELVEAIHAVNKGEIVLAPNLAGRILGRLGARAEQEESADDALSSLTKREHSVLTLVAEGLSNRQVAVKLGLTERTVKNYMTSIMTKLEVSNRVEAGLKLKPRHPT